MVVTVNDGYCTHEAKFSSSESVNVDELSIQDFFDCIKNTLSLKIENQRLIYGQQVKLPPTADWAANFNICCAKFLGARVEPSTLSSGVTYYYYKTPKNNYLNEICGVSEEETWKKFTECKYANFHKDWGSIMKVVDEIEKKDGEVIMTKISATIKFLDATYSVTSTSKKEALIEALKSVLYDYYI